MEDIKNDLTTAWRCYEHGRQYNNSLTPNQYRMVNTNIEFFTGNQWMNLPQTPAMRGLAKPVFNICKRILQLFVASLTANGTTVAFDSLSYADGENLDDPDYNAAAIATAEVQNLFDKFKMEYRIREALFDGGQTGDYCAHFYWDPDAIPYGGAFGDYRGEIQMELVDGLNIMFGNPNTYHVEKQPYILVIGRDTVANLKAEKRQYNKRHHKADNFELDLIRPDSDTRDQAGVGGRNERAQADDGADKCLYIYMYTKQRHEEDVLDEDGEPVMEVVTDDKGEPVPAKNSEGKPMEDLDGNPIYKKQKKTRMVTSVHVTKATKTCNIFEDVDTGMTRYPIAWGNWERQKNQYHGRALITDIIPNQIFVNTMWAMVMRHLQLMGFPKTVYNADLISSWNNEIGQAIAVRNLTPGQRIGDVATNLQPADMSYQIMSCIDKTMQYTKDCLGATDVQMGSVTPDNTSALMVLQSNAEVPLENPRACLLEWVEDIGAILLDMMGTYYGVRDIIHDRSMPDAITQGKGMAPMLDPQTGMMMEKKVTKRVKEPYDFSQFKHLYLNLRADVGATSTYSEIAMTQTLDNLRRDGTLDIINYLERIPDKLIPKKNELIQQLRDQSAMQAGQDVGGMIPNSSGTNTPSAPTGKIDTDKARQSLPNQLQNQFDSLPQKAKDSLMLAAGR